MKKRRILVVDDDVAASRMLKLGLEKTGAYEVQVENSSTRAVAICRTFHPDLILSDVCMPDMDGGELAARIRSDPRLRDTPVLFLTSIVSKDEAGQSACTSGGYEFIAKPVDIRTLIQHIEKHLPSETQSPGVEGSAASESVRRW
jgi:CheY-like chemotaxis protein